MNRILFVDDDKELLEANTEYFTEHGYEVFRAQNAKQALEIINTVQLDCVILDVNLPDESGFDVCIQAREHNSIPIIFLSAYTEEEIRINGLLVGGDDYVCKPFSLKELELRVGIRIRRRYEEQPAEILQFGDLNIDTGRRLVSCEQKQYEFLRIEFDILIFLAKHPNQVFSYEQLYDRVWNEPIGRSRHNLQAQVAKVRQKLSAISSGKEYIKTVRHKGYYFSP